MVGAEVFFTSLKSPRSFLKLVLDPGLQEMNADPQPPCQYVKKNMVWYRVIRISSFVQAL